MTLPTILLIAACVAVAIGGWAYCSAVKTAQQAWEAGE